MKGAALIFSFILYSFCFGQNKPNTEKAKPVKVYVGGSMGKAFTNLNTSYLMDTWTGAYDGRLYFSRGLCRWLLEVQNIPPVDLKSGWKQVHAIYYDFNLNLSDEEDGIPFYPIIGITYEFISGVDTRSSSALVNAPVVSRIYHAGYWGANAGGGIDIKVHKQIRVFGETKFRIMKNGGSLGYNELFFCCGIRLAVAQFKLRKIFRKPGDKYHWF